jgi:hypothetical protein
MNAAAYQPPRPFIVEASAAYHPALLSETSQLHRQEQENHHAVGICTTFARARNEVKLRAYPEIDNSFVFWRRKRDSNPRNPFEFNGFQDRRIKPLSHSSVLYFT